MLFEGWGQVKNVFYKSHVDLENKCSLFDSKKKIYQRLECHWYENRLGKFWKANAAWSIFKSLFLALEIKLLRFPDILVLYLIELILISTKGKNLQVCKIKPPPT